MLGDLIQPWHLIVILVIVLIVFGPGKLPEIGGALGKGIREFKRSSVYESDRPEKVASGVVSDNVVPITSTKRICPACQAENPTGNKFCGTCGKDLA